MATFRSPGIGWPDGQLAVAPVRRNRLCICNWPALHPSARAPLTETRAPDPQQPRARARLLSPRQVHRGSRLPREGGKVVGTARLPPSKIGGQQRLRPVMRAISRRAQLAAEAAWVRAGYGRGQFGRPPPLRCSWARRRFRAGLGMGTDSSCPRSVDPLAPAPTRSPTIRSVSARPLTAVVAIVLPNAPLPRLPPGSRLTWVRVPPASFGAQVANGRAGRTGAVHGRLDETASDDQDPTVTAEQIAAWMGTLLVEASGDAG